MYTASDITHQNYLESDWSMCSQRTGRKRRRSKRAKERKRQSTGRIPENTGKDVQRSNRHQLHHGICQKMGWWPVSIKIMNCRRRSQFHFTYSYNDDLKLYLVPLLWGYPKLVDDAVEVTTPMRDVERKRAEADEKRASDIEIISRASQVPWAWVSRTWPGSS